MHMTADHIRTLLTKPQDLISQEPWRTWVQQSGGLQAIYAQLRGLPLPETELAVLDSLLVHPGRSAQNHAHRLGMHRSTYYRHLTSLLAALLAHLSLDDPAPPPTPPASAGAAPAPITRLIGREEECAALTALLADPGLITITGPGGVGKTRLALELISQAPAGGAVCFVPLLTISAPELVPAAIAHALGLEQGTERALLSRIQELTVSQPLLLVLDNFEHVLAAADLAGRLLQANSRLTLLVTSRAALRLRGEREFPLRPLATPAANQRLSLAELTMLPAVRLFVERAQEVRREFHLSAENAAAVAQICRRLDGLPLALEIAAARSRIFAPAALAARLERQFDVLVGSAVDRPQRHQTITATIDWSYQLLSAAEQTVFRRLSIFASPWSLEAACAIGADDAIPPLELELIIEALISHSLLSAQENSAGEIRFAMLELIRSFAAAQLDQAEAAELAARHARFYQDQAEAAAPGLVGADQAAWLRALEEDHSHFLTALEWAVGRKDRPVAFGLAGALWRFWYTRGYNAEGSRWLEAVLALGDETVPTQAMGRVLLGAGVHAWVAGDTDRAPKLLAQSREYAAKAGDIAGEATAMNFIAISTANSGDLPAALTIFEHALALWRQTGNQWGIAMCLGNIGITIVLARQDPLLAIQYYQEALAMHRAMNYIYGIGVALSSIGYAKIMIGEIEHALAFLHESLLTLGKIQGMRLMLVIVENVSGGLRLLGNYPAAICLLSGVGKVRHELGIRAIAHDRQLDEEVFHMEALRAELPPAEWDAAWAQGQQLTDVALIALALELTAPFARQAP